MAKQTNKTKVAGHTVRMVEKETEINPLEGMGKIPPIRNNGIAIIPSPMVSDLESVLWVSVTNFNKIKKELGGK
jgi:hypothetical protein